MLHVRDLGKLLPAEPNYAFSLTLKAAHGVAHTTTIKHTTEIQQAMHPHSRHTDISVHFQNQNVTQSVATQALESRRAA